jgi:pyrroloquinoline-quinone synthase
LTKCPSCGVGFQIPNDWDDLAGHFVAEAGRSDAGHVMWLNRNITKNKSDRKTLSKLLAEFFSLGSGSLESWVKRRFIEKFYGQSPHPFVLALQHPSRAVLLGYVVEHQHFLRQWVRSCSYIMARTDEMDVVLYELNNINTEYAGLAGQPSHYELLLRMGESLGLDRKKVFRMAPLEDTREAIRVWDSICRDDHWVEGMAAMHGLELIANRKLKGEGASIGYFDPVILKNQEISTDAKAFLREGYDADVGHSEEALGLAEKYSKLYGNVDDVQATFLRSIDYFDRYLMARLERSRQFESS